MTSFYSTRSRYPAMVFPMIWYHYYADSPRIESDFGVRLENAGMFMKDGKRNNFFCTLESVKNLQERCVQKMIHEVDFIENVQKKLLVDSEKFRAFIFANKSLDTSVLSDEELLDIFNKYNQIFTELNYPVLFLTLLCTDDIAEQVKNTIPDQKDFETLSKPSQLPYLMEYELDILRGNAKDAQALYDKWFWVPFDYYGADEWDINHLLTELAKPKDDNKFTALENYQKNTSEEQKNVIKKYTLNSDSLRAITCLQIISYIQDERKRVTNESYPFLEKKIISEFSRRTGIPNDELWLMLPEEIQAALAGEKKSFAHRKKSCAVEIHNGTFVIHEKIPDFLVEDDVLEHINLNVIYGTIASMGVTQGIVKVCSTSQEIKKIGKGDILVAPATTPDYIVGFRLAGAVITDEGGLTSHAAVVSREMKLPCIIGTKNASVLLKDGDFVEVDANVGMIRILR